MPCVVCGHWVYEVRVNEAIEDDDSGRCYFCHFACRYWYHERAAEIAAGAERAQQADAEQLGDGDGDAMVFDFPVDADTTPPSLAIAEQISPADGQDAIYANYHERAMELEEEAREAKEEFMSMLAARGGN